MNVEAITAFVDRLEKCQNQLDRLGQLVDQQGKIPPEQIGWQHVDDLLWINEPLQRAIDHLSHSTVKQHREVLRGDRDWESLI